MPFPAPVDLGRLGLVHAWPGIDAFLAPQKGRQARGERGQERPDSAVDARAKGRRRCDGQGMQPHILNEALFRDAFRRSRRRAERFDDAFALILLRLSDRTAPTRAGVTQAIGAALDEGAIVGWAHRDRELGVILPDLGLAAAGSARDVALRLRRALTRALGMLAPERVAIRIRIHERPALEAAGAEPLEADWPDVPSTRRLDCGKRALDVVGSALLLLATSPLFLAIAALVEATSPGPVLFRQSRIGQGARPFTMLKFRTMQTGADPALHQQYVSGFIKADLPASAGEVKVFKIANDPRVTPIGKFLRRTSLDELPQFWNVFRGEMSLVGPRPPLQYELEQYRAWHWRRVLDCKPGMTGLWQVKGRSRTTFDEMVRMDLQYARRRSLWFDIRILLATPRAVITGKGAM